MKKIILLTLFSPILSCNTDNFYDTNRIITTDKKEYKIGDDFEIKLSISPKKEAKEIRIYENFKNLEISFALVNEQKEILNEDWSQNSGLLLKETKIKNLVIYKEKPFIKIFKGKITEKGNFVEIRIPELKMVARFEKSKLKDETLVRVHGFCNPINPEFGASLEEYFESKDIRIIPE